MDSYEKIYTLRTKMDNFDGIQQINSLNQKATTNQNNQHTMKITIILSMELKV